MTISDKIERSSSPGSHRSARIALVNMPFARTIAPSIQLGILKAELIRAGHIATVYYLNLELAFDIGAKQYEDLSSRYANSNVLLGEWLFSSAAFGYRANEDEYWATCLQSGKLCADFELEWLSRLRKEVLPDFIQRWVKRIDWGSYDAIGFTSTFAQNNASFALARAIKTQYPQVIIIFGGSNFHGVMGKEFLRKLTFIDYVVDGEGEEAIVALAHRLARGESAFGIPGVSGRTNKDIIFDDRRATKAASMDMLADPDYNEYFETLWRLGPKRLTDNKDSILPFETARGCWWGEKHHCTFCGLNGQDMAFRSKSSERVLQELKNLTERYQILKIFVVDNILNVKYIDKVCKYLIQERCDYIIFWEVKANLTPAQLKAMVSAGIIDVVPGIESLSTHVLGLMRKGISMLKNVRFLKWAHYFNIYPRWHMLTGFPGETAEDYAGQRRLIPLLKHLTPPGDWNRIWLERYSPYFFDPSFPVENVRPGAAYRFVYPESEIDLKEVAYFFDYDMKDTLPDECHEEFFALLHEWRQAWKKTPAPALMYRRGPSWLEVIDQRVEEPRHHWLYGVEASAYEACSETDHNAEAVWRILGGETGGAQLEDVAAALKKCCGLGIMIEEDGHYFSLALPANRNWFLDHAGAATRPAAGARPLEPSVSVAADSAMVLKQKSLVMLDRSV